MITAGTYKSSGTRCGEAAALGFHEIVRREREWRDAALGGEYGDRKREMIREWRKHAHDAYAYTKSQAAAK